MTKLIDNTILTLTILILSTISVSSQDLYFAVSANEDYNALNTVDIWIKPEIGAGKGTLHLFDAATGSSTDKLSGSANTTTAFELYDFNQLYRIDNGIPVKRNITTEPLSAINTQNETKFYDSWQPMENITSKEHGYVLRVRAVSGNDLNNFKVRVLTESGSQNSKWVTISLDLSISLAGLPSAQSVQLKPYTNNIRTDRFELNASPGLNARLLDRFGNFYDVENASIPDQIQNSQNEWLLSLGGTGQQDANISITSASSPQPWIIDPVFTPFQDPNFVLKQLPSTTCSEKSFELTSPFLNSTNLRNILWQINGETVARGANPTLQFESRGEVDLTVRIPNSIFKFPEEWVINRTLQINQPPIARLNVPKTEIALSEVVTLSAAESYDLEGKPLNFYWFVNGELQATTPSLNFSSIQPGIYIISVRVNNGGDIPNCSNSQKQIRIQVSDNAVISGQSERRIVAPEIVSDGKVNVTFTNGQTPLPANYSYEWDMGDGTVLNGLTVDHTYQKPGSFEITLTVNDGKNLPKSAEVWRHTVIVNRFPKADFVIPEIVPAKVPISLDGRSSSDEDGVITSYEWFLDGKPIASGPQPEIIIDEPGEHVLSLKVRDNSGNEIAQSLMNKTVWANYAPVIKWSVSPDPIGPGDKITLDASDTYDPDGEIKTISWSFGDGKIVEGPIANLSFEESGVHYFTITATDNEGQPNSKKSVEGTINVNHTPYIVTESLIRSNSLDVTLDATSTYDADGDPLYFEWTLPDGSKRTEAGFSWKAPEFGVHILNLKVNDGQGLDNSQTEKMIRVLINRPVQAVADSVVISCAGQTILFNSSQSFDPDGDAFDVKWDFGNGDVSESANPSYVYDRPGIYDAILTLTDGISEIKTTTKIPIIIEGSPVAKMNIADSTVCVDTALEFDGSNSVDPSGALPSLLWDFGDGTIETGPRIRHVYSQPGVYPVTLTVEGSGSINCGNTNQARSVIRVIEGPQARYEVPDWIEPGQTLQLDGTASTSDEVLSVIEWEIQEKDTLIRHSGYQARHQFSKPGEYLVTLNLKTNSNTTCSSASLTKAIRVNSPPQINWELPEKVAAGSDLELNAMASLDPDGYIKEYKWYYDGELISKNAAELIKAVEPGPHTIRLEITDNSPTSNNRAVAEKTFIANSAPKPQISTSRVRFIGEEITLLSSPDKDADGQVVTNTWHVDNQPIKGNVFTPAEPRKYRITLVQNDQQNAPNSIDSAVVEITPDDIPHIDPIYPQSIIQGESVSIQQMKVSEDWRVKDGNSYKTTWTAEKVGDQSIDLYWFYEGDVIFNRSFPIQVKPPLSFSKPQTTLSLNWNPVNPVTIINAPDLNRSINEVRFTWINEQGNVIGYGAQYELELKKGENRFRVKAEDLNTKGSSPKETDLIIITE